jgi:uncharacterized iron-regulated membrane protein
MKPTLSPNPTATAETRAAVFYRTVWRWHFLAGVCTAPVAIFLAITGGLYLWRPQYEDWRYHRLLHVPASEHGAGASLDAQFAAARATHPEAGLVSFAPASAPGRSSETVLSLRDGDSVSVFVDPTDAHVLGERRDSERLMQKLRALHGTLLIGKAGQFVTELAATWMFVLVLTGFYLWWPRPKFSAWGFILPRLRSGRRVFWRDAHAVTAVWGSAGMLLLLATGMLWTQAGGGWYRMISAALGQGTPRAAEAGAHQSALLGWSPPLRAGLAQTLDQAHSQPPGGAQPPPAPPHAHHHGHGAGAANLAPGALTLARVEAIAQSHGMPADHAILFPSGPTGVFSVVSDRDRPFERTYLHLDQYSGGVLADVRYGDFGLLGRFGLWAIIAHEGHLFGLLNQILGTCAALGVLLIAVAGLMLWRVRAGMPAGANALGPLPLPVKVGVGVLAGLLPLLSVSLVAIFAVDRLILRNRLGALPTAGPAA